MATLTIDDRSGNRNEDEVTEGVTWEQAEAAIRSLDAQQRTMVTIELDEVAYLAVGGGGGRYLVTIATPEETFLTLSDPSKPDEETEELVTGGQAGNHPRRTVVGLDVALTAARSHLESGKPDPSLTWLDE